MTNLDLIIDLHRTSERQGPGSTTDTLRALEMIRLPANRKLKIADIGCGNGGQTITLAKHLDCEIVAVDLFPEFLEELEKKATQLGLDGSITTMAQSMDDLPFATGYFDLIWSEGAIYNIGFNKGISVWHKFLKPGGCLAASEITWITDQRPKEIQDYWHSEYPEIDIASNKISSLENNGYSLLAYFCLPQSSWLEQYYGPMQKRFNSFLARHNHSEDAQSVVHEYEEEIAMYEKFKDFFSYGFYIARKNAPYSEPG
jgi:SAM-dependent methyltransferase